MKAKQLRNLEKHSVLDTLVRNNCW